MPNHIFISYSREDQPYAHKLADHLRQHGFDIWMDDRIDFGDRWWRTIVQALQDSAAFVVLMTPDSENSDWVHREVLLALEERKPIFPLLLHGRRFSILVDFQYATVTGARMPSDRFIDRLRQVIPLPQAPQPPPPQPEPQKKQPVVPAWQLLEPEMVLIPAGEFLMGSDPQKDKGAYKKDEQPQHTLYLPDYYIAKTPVTNKQYALFVQATHRKPPKHWLGRWSPVHKEDHPVIHVSLQDAVDYCRWLAGLTGKPYRLPSEAEWEKAARGTAGRIYPWGDDWDPHRCNIREASPGQDTRSVTAYPQGASPYGLLDMAGNVWEWTRSLYRRYPYDPGDGREDPKASGRRVRHGGSWYYGRRDARCAFRDYLLPGYFLNNFGFRVVFPGSPAS